MLTWVASLLSNVCLICLLAMWTWDAHDPAFNRPLAAPLERCAELLGVDLAPSATWPPMSNPTSAQLERRLRPDAYGRVRGGYLSPRRARATGA
jgi:hypothetical protein